MNNQFIGKLVMHRYGSVGIIKSSYYNTFHKENLYEVSWLKVVEREEKALCFSLYFKQHEIDKMLYNIERYKNNGYEFSSSW